MTSTPDAKGAQPGQLVETKRREIKEATAILADWAEEGGYNSTDIDDERATVLEAFAALATALSECREREEETLAAWYARHPAEAASWCDEVLDRSGALLGRVRARHLPLAAQPPSEAVKARAGSNAGVRTAEPAPDRDRPLPEHSPPSEASTGETQ